MKGPRDMNCCKAKKTKQQHQGESDNNGKTHSYTYNIVCGAWLITDTYLQYVWACVLAWQRLRKRTTSTPDKVRRAGTQCKKDKIEENKIFKKNQRELMFNHITRCPSPLWGDSQGSFTASSADLKSTSSLTSMYSLSLCSTRQAISTLAALSFHLTKTAHTTMLCHFCLNAAYGHKKPDHVLRAFPHRALHKYKKGVAINFSTFNHAVITVHLNKSSQREARISLCNILTYPW